MIEELIVEYGLIAVFLGCMFEGDTAALTGGVLAHRGLLPFWGTVAAAAAGGFTTDTVTFWLGRYFKDHPRVLRAVSHPWAQKLTRHFLARPILLAAIFRFIPGARTIAPVMLATATQIRGRIYTPITMISAALWGFLLVGAGQEIGALFSRFFGELTRVEIVLLIAAGILMLFGLRAIIRFIRNA
ncbi:DedA family protein [Litorisediminicola beolgyonensis]|uniref:DedA family protein n=1 Tax=Litorisediminicola beolgyonensis TaxID=1173614 RepID=A0ABW3ZJU7_9RHOB